MYMHRGRFVKYILDESLRERIDKSSNNEIIFKVN